MDKYKAVIERAVENGYREKGLYASKEKTLSFLLTDYEAPTIPELLFNHDFAKAFFGEDEIIAGERYTDGEDIDNLQLGQSRMVYARKTVVWQHRLQEAVLCPSPLNYYYNHL